MMKSLTKLLEVHDISFDEVVKEFKDVLTLFPPTWTHPANINWNRVGYRLKLMGIDWHTNEEFAQQLSTMEFVGLLERDKSSLLVKRSHACGMKDDI